MLRLTGCRNVWAGISLLVILCAARPVTAGRDNTVNADIYRENGFLTVWVDLSGQISSEHVEILKEGVDLALEYRADLLRSRRFWGTVRINRASTAIVISYHLLSKEYSLKYSGDYGDDSERRFATLAGLHQYLADSIVLPLSPIDSLENDLRYYIELSISCISMTSLNLGSPSGAHETPLKFLFRHFLSLTGYGREQSVVSSDSFRLVDIRSGR